MYAIYYDSDLTISSQTTSRFGEGLFTSRSRRITQHVAVDLWKPRFLWFGEGVLHWECLNGYVFEPDPIGVL